ncbi:MAG: CinA family protein [Bacilli bacterium]|nr:CinA family protein [Bacilli bacterium]
MSESKAETIVKNLKERGLTIGSVESLTAGLFASTIASIPGASEVLSASYVTYKAEQKEKLLGISHDEIIKYGVVSQHIANEMAMRGRKRLGVDICVSFTGNAGPTSEPGSAPVGRVNMAVSTKYGLVEIQQDFEGLRNEIRSACVEMMLDQLISILG